MDVKNHMLPIQGKLQKPERSAFVCVSHYDMSNAQERRIASSANLRCFDLPFNQGLGVCCDNRGHECAQLHPALFPELMNKGHRSNQYEPPKSNWVKPRLSRISGDRTKVERRCLMNLIDLIFG